VNEALGVDRAEGSAQLLQDSQRAAWSERAVAPHVLVKVFAGQVLQGDKISARTCLTAIDEAHDVRMRQEFERVDLALEAAGAGGVGGVLGPQNFHRGPTSGDAIDGQIHDAHAARTELPDDGVAIDLGCGRDAGRAAFAGQEFHSRFAG
jgi:hypothetical protein